MQKPSLRYDKLVENALRSVVRDALSVAATHGLFDGHHFYVTFKTGFPGVEIPPFLHAQYPDEMTIVLEHQFWDLEVGDSAFNVTLSFQSQPKRLVIPLAAITGFTDPSVSFGLEFQSETDGAVPEAAEPVPDQREAAGSDAAGQVVRLDMFRIK